MDIALYLKAMVLGIIEGLTEFLPISSTGHLIIASDLLDFNRVQQKTFEVFIQLGAILSVCWIYRARLMQIAGDLRHEPAARRLMLNLAIAFFPAAAIGFFTHDFIKSRLFSPIVVASALILGGVAILIIERLVNTASIHAIDDMDAKQALKIGLAQTLALIPGVSRSGATIMGGMLAGLSRQAATEFSFFLAIPIMFAATIFDLFKSWDTLEADDIGIFGAGFVSAFLSALLAIKFLLRYVSSHDFSVFAYYRIGFGLLVLAYYLL